MYPQQGPYQTPAFRPCAQCGGFPGHQPLYSPQGHPLCQMCFNMVSQQAANGRAQQSAFGGGYLHLGNSDASMQAGLQQDLEAKLLRKCQKCQAHAVSVVHVTFHYVNGITRGRTYENACKACNFRFKTESVLRTIVETGSGGICALIGAGVLAGAISSESVGWYLLFILLLPLGGWMAGRSLMRVVSRFRNPTVPKLPGAV